MDLPGFNVWRLAFAAGDSPFTLVPGVLVRSRRFNCPPL
jgi:hypothetical protein